MSTGPKRTLRCAIYTRKSSEEGLEQSFNSLDAQREACEAYILSQRQEGWRGIETRYDDGGYSGGSMERPALKQLLADIDARKIDVVVGRSTDPEPCGLRQDRPGIRFPERELRFCHAAVQYDLVNGAFDTERAAVVRAV